MNEANTRDDVTDCRGGPLDLETLDPGIRELVHLLLEAGFKTCDSGDGRHKATTGEYEEGSYSDLPHVVVRTDEAELRELGFRLMAFLEGLGADNYSVQAEFFVSPSGPGVVLLVGGDGLYNLGRQP